MFYSNEATKKTPALIIYLLDMSISMSDKVGDVTKSELVSQTLVNVVREMVRRSTKGNHTSPRYHIAAFAYNDEVYDVFGGVKTVTEVLEIGVPVMSPDGRTDTAKAFERAERLLHEYAGRLDGCPAPMVCHLTDGLYTAEDPRPIVNRIKGMTFPDGPVLVENVLFDDSATHEQIDDLHKWRGISSAAQLASTYATDLYEMSSAIPESYHGNLADRGYQLDPQARLFFPGNTPEMVEIAFTTSSLTKTTK
jgi:hypothetical protein